MYIFEHHYLLPWWKNIIIAFTWLFIFWLYYIVKANVGFCINAEAANPLCPLKMDTFFFEAWFSSFSTCFLVVHEGLSGDGDMLSNAWWAENVDIWKRGGYDCFVPLIKEWSLCLFLYVPTLMWHWRKTSRLLRKACKKFCEILFDEKGYILVEDYCNFLVSEMCDPLIFDDI